MFLKHFKSHLTGLALAISGLALHNGALAIDLLQAPSIPSTNATRSLLLDVQRVGTDLYAVGEFGQILRSRDNGGSWKAATISASVTLTSISFGDELHGFAVGHDGIVLRTENGGESWEKILDGGAVNQFVLDAANERVSDMEARLLAIPESDADTREAVEVKLEDAQFLADTAQGDLEVGPSKPLLDVLSIRGGVVLAAGAYGQLIMSEDEGRSWTYLGTRVPNPNGYHLNSLMQDSKGNVWVAGEQGRVFMSADRGKTWRNVSIAYDGSIFDLVELPDTGAIVALGLRGNVFKLNPGKDDWTAVETDIEETLSSALVLKDGSVLLVGARGVVVRSADGFKTLQVHRRADKLPSVGAVQINDETVLLTGLKGFRELSLSVFQ